MLTMAGSLLAVMAVIGSMDGAGREIAGTVVSPDDRPVAGIEVVLTAGPAPDGSVPILARATTGADGRFRLGRPDAVRAREFLSPGVIWAYRPGLGLGIVDLVREDRPDRSHRMIVEPQEPRRLTIRDADGRPVAGARVFARLVQSEQTGYLGAAIPDEWLDRLAAATDARGEAILPGLTHRIDLRSVRIAVAGRGAHVAVLRYDDGKLDVTIAMGRPSALEGTVRDESGGPVAGATVEVWTRCGSPLASGSTFYVLPERLRPEGGPIRTDGRGGFRIAAGPMTGATCRVVVRADGRPPAVSDWIRAKGKVATIPPVTIRRTRTIAGLVRDRQGRPIAGARVSQHGGGPSATSDEAGRFRLIGARPGHSFVLARRDGFRFEGMLMGGSEDRPIELTLTRPGEPPGRTLATLPGPVPEEESRALARRVIGPYTRRALAEGDDAAKYRCLALLRWLDPVALLEQVEKTRFERATTADLLRGEAALGLAASDPEEAAAVAETIADPADRAGTLVDLADAMPAADRARKLALLDRAALQARAASMESNKLFQMGEVAERWLELGEADKARALFAEGRRLVETEPPDSRTNAGMFLAHLSRVEPAVPVPLIENVGQARWRERIYGNIAIRLAFEHPAEAEAMLDRLQDPVWRLFGAPRICRRLALTDRPRARRIAGRLPHAAERAYAWTFLAVGLAEADRTAAASALDEAMRQIDAIDPADRSVGDGPNPAASILPLVERIAPDRLEEVFWRAVALISPGDDPRIDFDRDVPLPSEAILLSRYDREAARVLFEPVAAFVRSRPLRDDRDFIPAVVVALGCLDPRNAVEVLESLPPATGAGIGESPNWSRIVLAEILARPPDRRWMGIWRFYSGCGIAMFEDVYRGL